VSWAPPVRAVRMLLGKAEAKLETRLHGAILKSREFGQLDLANKLSEFLHWSQRGYNPNLIGKLMNGLPPLPKGKQ